ncbi:hypothetical protein [Mycobacterium sp. 852002-51163_SCH5372311]|uniref:Rv2732c family membrane protein n=1 Tax=Mycobacterium sp. 852002-51163_SCH5372311 TaxID=1834097 RepID=UPI0009EEE724
MNADPNGTDFDAFRSEIEAAERRIAREIEPGPRGFVVAILVFVLLGSFALSHTGNVRGWDVLFSSHGAGAAAVALPSRVFAWLALVFGVGFSMLALLTRRWALAWIALAGSALACGAGMLAIWSRQTVTAGHPGPGVGLFVAWITVILLTFHWTRVVWARTIVQLAAEEQRRRVVAQQQSRTLLDALDGTADDPETPEDRATPDGADDATAHSDEEKDEGKDGR